MSNKLKYITLLIFFCNIFVDADDSVNIKKMSNYSIGIGTDSRCIGISFSSSLDLHFELRCDNMMISQYSGDYYSAVFNKIEPGMIYDVFFSNYSPHNVLLNYNIEPCRYDNSDPSVLIFIFMFIIIICLFCYCFYKIKSPSSSNDWFTRNSNENSYNTI